MSILDMETTTFIPSDKPAKTNEIVAEGKYKAAIVKVEKKQQDKVIPSRTENGVNHVADMLQVEYVLSDDNANHAGRHVWSSPIWIWKDTPHIKTLGLDTLLHVPNTNNNFRYHKFLEVAGYDIEEKVVEVQDSNGKTVKRKAFTLPVELDLSIAEGSQCIIDVKHEKWTNKEGEERTTAKERGLYELEGAEKIDIKSNDDDDDLPF